MTVGRAAPPRDARDEQDYGGEQFLGWFLAEQLEEVASMTTLLAVIKRAGTENLLLVEDQPSPWHSKPGGALHAGPARRRRSRLATSRRAAPPVKGAGETLRTRSSLRRRGRTAHVPERPRTRRSSSPLR